MKVKTTSAKKNVLLTILSSVFVLFLALALFVSFTKASPVLAVEDGIFKMDISISDDITVRFYTHGGDRVVCQLGENEPVELTGTKTEGDYTIFSFGGVAPQYIGTSITATLYNGETQVGETKTKSVKEYLTDVKSKQAANEWQQNAMIDVCNAMLNYGAAAQTYLAAVNGETLNDENKINYGLNVTVPDYVAEETSSTGFEKNNANGIVWKGAGLRFDYALSVYFVFEAASVDGLTAKIDNVDVAINVYDAEKNQYIVRSSALNAAALLDNVTVEIGDASCTYGIKQYANANFGSENKTAMANLVKAAYAYGKAAHAYAEFGSLTLADWAFNEENGVATYSELNEKGELDGYKYEYTASAATDEGNNNAVITWTNNGVQTTTTLSDNYIVVGGFAYSFENGYTNNLSRLSGASVSDDTLMLTRTDYSGKIAVKGATATFSNGISALSDLALIGDMNTNAIVFPNRTDNGNVHNGKLTLNGDITTGNITARSLQVDDGAATVTGDVLLNTNNDYNPWGQFMSNGGSLVINGNLTVTGDNTDSERCRINGAVTVSAVTAARVDVNGTLTADTIATPRLTENGAVTGTLSDTSELVLGENIKQKSDSNYIDQFVDDENTNANRGTKTLRIDGATVVLGSGSSSVTKVYNLIIDDGSLTVHGFLQVCTGSWQPGTLTVNGGELNLPTTTDSGNVLESQRVTINGGTVTANGNVIVSWDSVGYFVMNGGETNVNGEITVSGDANDEDRCVINGKVTVNTVTAARVDVNGTLTATTIATQRLTENGTVEGALSGTDELVLGDNIKQKSDSKYIDQFVDYGNSDANRGTKTLRIDGATVVLGSGSSSVTKVNNLIIDGGSLTVHGFLQVCTGSWQPGTLTVNGGELNLPTTAVSDNAGINGNVLQSQKVTINGGTVTANGNVIVSWDQWGQFMMNDGTVAINGALEVTGNNDDANRFYVKSGVLNINSGDKVALRTNRIEIGSADDSTAGHINITTNGSDAVSGSGVIYKFNKGGMTIEDLNAGSNKTAMNVLGDLYFTDGFDLYIWKFVLNIAGFGDYLSIKMQGGNIYSDVDNRATVKDYAQWNAIGTNDQYVWGYGNYEVCNESDFNTFVNSNGRTRSI